MTWLTSDLLNIWNDYTQLLSLCYCTKTSDRIYQSALNTVSTFFDKKGMFESKHIIRSN